ncbi:hypothetical protein [Microbacterium lacticum]|uniref:hypothetical protein n=1 Tax=Microbacterium lacticum TaxID=33885 RepID=UPI001F59DBF6|nr:hypothetical protein [Microbacterium lacticum]
MWQGVERKGTFIAQLMRGRLDTREIEEIDSSALSAAEAKAISSGNPLLLEHSTVQNEVTRLRRLERAHQRNESMLVHTRDRARADARRAQTDIDGLEAAMPHVRDTSGDRFRMRLRSRDYDSRVDAGHALMSWARDSGFTSAPLYASREYGVIGSISGFDVQLSTHPMLRTLMGEVGLVGVPRSGFSMSREAFLDGGTGLIQRIENRVSGIPALLEQARGDRDAAQQSAAEAQARIGLPFKHATALTAAEEDLTRVEAQLAAMQDKAEPEPTATERASLTVEVVNAHRPTLGIRSHPDRHPAAFEPKAQPAPSGHGSNRNLSS